MRLVDLGERKLTEEILKKYVDGNFGDDCAEVESGGTRIVVTTDPVPRPAATVIGKDADLYWMGWLLVVINASDLAAAGAAPLGFLAALDLQRDMSVEDLERLLTGIKDACKSEGLPYIGGNVREAKELSAVGTAVGTTGARAALRRVGARSGDQLMIIGGGGRFWSDAITVHRGGSVDRNSSPLFRPQSQLAVMHRLRDEGLIAAAMDNSDGLLPSLTMLGKANGIGVRLNLDPLNRHANTADRARAVGVDPPGRLWLGWGDWNIVCAVSSNNALRVQEICRSLGTEAICCGAFDESCQGVLIECAGESLDAPRLESERFAQDSWFSAGIESYIQTLLTCDLPRRG